MDDLLYSSLSETNVYSHNATWLGEFSVQIITNLWCRKNTFNFAEFYGKARGNRLEPKQITNNYIRNVFRSHSPLSGFDSLSSCHIPRDVKTITIYTHILFGKSPRTPSWCLYVLCMCWMLGRQESKGFALAEPWNGVALGRTAQSLVLIIAQIKYLL